MKNFYHSRLLTLPAGLGKLFTMFCMLFLSYASLGQSLSLSLSATNNAPNNCTVRTISVSVSGGSGNYAYYWSSEPPSNVYLGNGSSITVSPSVATTYTVAVHDNSSGTYAEKSIVASPLLTGNLSYQIPSAFMEGSLWQVMDGNEGTGPLNAYRYELSIIDDWGKQVYAASRTVSSGTTGLVGGEISWNGRLYGTGGYVPAGNYFYDLRLINCSTNQLFRGTVTFFRPMQLSAEAYLNPASTYVVLDVLQEENLPKDIAVTAEVELLSREGEVLMAENVSLFPARLDVSALPEDDYLLVLHCGNSTMRKRLLIRR